MPTPAPIPFTFAAPRDGSTPAVEHLEWLTDVQTSRAGTEARRGLRAFPRHMYSFDVYMATIASKYSMQALREETSFLVPLWPHVFERPETGPSAGVSGAGDAAVMLLDHRGEFAQGVSPVEWAPGYDVAAPCAVARYAGDQRGFQHRTGRVSTGGVSFRLEGFQEAVAAYDGPKSSSMPDLFLLDPFTGAGDGLAEQIDVNANASDNGLIDLWEARYMQRTYTVNVVLNSRAAIVDFRRLLFALRGRLNPVRWTAPRDVGEKTWRLASDGVELSYLRPGLAKVALSLTELNE